MLLLRCRLTDISLILLLLIRVLILQLEIPAIQKSRLL
jgi:hypothetical protein